MSSHIILPAWTSQYRTLIDGAIGELIEESDSRFSDLMQEATLPGRKLRSTFALRLSHWLDFPKENYNSLLASLSRVELMHSASCIFDDIIDNDETRRGIPSFFGRNGISVAILTGLDMIAVATSNSLQQGVISRGFPDAIAQAIQESLEGEAIDSFPIAHTQHTYTNVKSAFEKYHLKTTPSFRLAHEAVAISRNLSTSETEQFGLYGTALGKLYQYTNDFFDWYASPENLRGSPDEPALLSLSLPAFLMLETNPKFSKAIGAYHSRKTLLDFAEQSKTLGVKEKARSIIDHAKREIITLFPGQDSTELEQMLDLVDSRRFWTYEYQLPTREAETPIN